MRISSKLKLAAVCLLAVFAFGFAALCEEPGVETVEARLIALGYLYPAEDEDYENRLFSAICNFQRANSLTVSGVVDGATYQALTSADAVSFNTYMADVQTDMSLSFRDNGKNVKSLQRSLAEMSYYAGEQNGEYDMDTACAVALFELVNGFEPDGLADSAVLGRLMSGSAVPLAGFENMAALKAGDRGAGVKYAQMNLAALGYFDGSADGVFGSATQKAVIDFERRNSLEETGTWKILYTVMARNSRAVDKRNAVKEEASTVLRPGDENYMVGELKMRLYELGYYSGERNCVYDERTRLAVCDFQEANALLTTGEADTVTREILSGDACVTMAEFVKNCRLVPLTYGQTGYGVYLLTARLQALGYPIAKGRIFDETVAQAVSIFQYAQDLPASDTVSREALDLIYSPRALAYSKAKPLADEKRAQAEFKQEYESFIEAVRQTVGKPYEPGISGPDSFGIGGFTQYCYGLIEIEIAPKVTLQLENAREAGMLIDDLTRINAGAQLFFRDGEQLYTGIVTDDGKLIYASPSEGKVIEIYTSEALAKYEFAGLVVYFYAP